MTTPAGGRYEILEKLGEGGMGVLYRARDTRLARTVALKLLRSDTLDDPDRRARFVREARTASALNHPAYMSPEQARGETVDARSDVFSFGAMLYEMLSGRRPFQGESVAALLSSILRDDPPPVEGLRAGIPSDVAAVVARCLARERDARYASAGEALQALEACQARLSRPKQRPWQVVAVVVALAALGALLGRQAWRASGERTARRETLPEIQRLVQADKIYDAFALARKAAPVLAGDPAFDKQWRDLSLFMDVRTSPEGAEIAVKPYLAPDAAWEVLGTSPLREARLPFAYLRWRLRKPGYETLEVAAMPMGGPEWVLTSKDSAPEGMVRVPGGPFRYGNIRRVRLDDFWLDRHEVTNRQFKAFVDQGGYRERRFWKEPFVRDGRVLAWDEAMALLRDGTGRPGPVDWELGSYPEGKQDYPVSGVSWYEAAAYAEYAGKSLPSFFHWYRAAELGIVSEILLLSNFGGDGPARVGRHQGLGPYGAYDQAGNVREWAWNATGERRYTLGGAWNDPTYLYNGPEIQRPWDRLPSVGFRLASYTAPPAAETLAPVEYGTFRRDYTRERPVDDAVFTAYRSLYAYDPTPLDARLEAADDSPPHWRRETISFAAAYGGERVLAHLYLPKSSPPPHQVVAYFPPSSAFIQRSSSTIGEREFSFLVRSGRAVLFPVYKGTFERRLPDGVRGPNVFRDVTIQWSKDLGRALDYLETRKDVRVERIGFHGLSLGADAGLLLAPLELRLAAIVLIGGGLSTSEGPGETDPLNFAPRVTAPVLLIAGRDDFRNPLEESQKPLMRLLGSKDKRHYVFEGGHVPPRQQEVIREALDWFDRYLGPV